MKINFKLLTLALLLTGLSFGQSILDPDQFHGPRTKMKVYDDPNTWLDDDRASIEPNMRGLTMSEWYSTLESLGANSATFNIDPRSTLLPPGQPMHPDAFALTEEQIANYEYTPEQRNEVLLDFLQQVQNAYDNGLITGNIKFHIHQRLYPNSVQREQDFVTDFSDFINEAKAAGLDDWIAGIRLGENGIGKTSINKILILSKQWASEINANTNDWLKTHGMEMSGTKYGLYFLGIHNRSNSSTFFQEMSQQTGYFTFCFKLFNDPNFNQTFTTLGYNIHSVTDWKTFLNNDCGFADLKTFITTFRNSYPMHANVIFVGDSGDALWTIRNLPEAYQAITDLFGEAGDGFSGIIGVNGYAWEKHSNVTVPDEYPYLNMYVVNPKGSTPWAQPLTIQRWEYWPMHDSNSSSNHIIKAMSNINGTILPSGPVPVANGSNQTFTIAPIDGYVIEDVLVNGVSQGAISSYTFSNVSTTHNIQALFTPATHYYISSVRTGHKIRPYDNSSGTPIVQAPSNYLLGLTQWELIPTSGDWFHLKNRENATYVKPYSNTNNSDVGSTTKTDTSDDTQWRKVDVGNGSFYLEHKVTGYYLKIKSLNNFTNGNDYELQIRDPATGLGNWMYFTFDEATTYLKTFDSKSLTLTDLADSNKISIYPNPSKGSFSLNLPQNTNKPKVNVSMYNINGQQVYNGKMEYSNKIDISTTLPQGLYFLKVVAGTKTLNTKLVVK